MTDPSNTEPEKQSELVLATQAPGAAGIVAKEQRAARDDISLLDLAIVLAEYKKLILGVPLLVAVVAAATTLLMPNIYTATTRILPPQQQQSAALSMLGQLTGLAAGTASVLGIKNPNDLYVGILKSESVSDAIIRRFDLRNLYEQDTLVETREALAKVVAVAAEDSGIISISVDDEDPQRAADIANAYVDALHAINSRLALTEASQRRLFFEKQLEQVKAALGNAEEALKQTQETTGVIELDEQAKALIAAVAALRAQIAAKEVALAAMRSYATENNPDYQLGRQELLALRTQLAKLEHSGDSTLVPSGRLPQVGLQSIRSLRDLKYYEKLFELTAQQYELARIDEARDASLVQVLDRATPPDDKSKPARTLIVIATACAAGLLTVMWAFLKKGLAGVGSASDHARRLREFRERMRQW